MYSVGSCIVANCPYLHDLSPDESRKLLLWWKKEDQQHVVFSHSQTDTGDSSHSHSERLPPCGSITELIESAASIPAMGPERQVFVRRLKEHFMDVSDQELRRLLPRDDQDSVTSIGGLLHESERCRPCRNLAAGQPCSRGIRCGFCHFPHVVVPSGVVEGAAPSGRKRSDARPGKAQRDKYRKHVESIEVQIRENPWTFDVSEVALPASIFEGRPEVTAKFKMRIAAYVDSMKALSQDGRAGSTAASSSGGYSALPQGSTPDRKTRNIVHL